MRRTTAFLLTVVVALVWLIPAAAPQQHLASAQTPAAGIPLSGDFRGAGGS